MDKIAETLERSYGAFINQTKTLSFFSGLADYMNYVVEVPILRGITDTVMKRKQNLNEELERLEKMRLEELEIVKSHLLKIIEDNKIDPSSLSSFVSFPPMNGEKGNLLTRLQDFESGRVSMSGFWSDNLEQYLFDIAFNLLKLGYKDSLKDYLVSGKEYGNYYSSPDNEIEITGNIYGNFIFSKILPLRRKQESAIEKGEKLDLWGALNPLLKFQYAYSRKKEGESNDEIINEFIEKNPSQQGDGGAYDVHKIIWDLDALTERFSNKTVEYLKVDTFKAFVERVHPYFLRELNKKELEKNEFSINFDEGRSILNIGSKTVKFRKFSEQYHVLRIIFTDVDNLRKEWIFSEIGEKIDEEKGYTDKQFHNYFAAIKRRIAAETSIKDLFITTTQSVKINEKYLKKI